MKKIVCILLLIIAIGTLMVKMFNVSFAYSYDINNSVLFYKDSTNELENDIKLYLSNIDDYIIPNSSFLYSDKLFNNYDFLVNFALDYILSNREYYYSDIKKIDKCSYMDRNGIDSFTFDYVNLNVVYDIVDFYFGVNDFSIINENICMVDDYISLSNYVDDNFNLKIDDVFVDVSGEDVKALVIYNDGLKYLYTFYRDNNILKIKNVEVN